MGQVADHTEQAIEEAKATWSQTIGIDDVMEEFASDLDAKKILDDATKSGNPALIGSVIAAVRAGLVDRLALGEVYGANRVNKLFDLPEVAAIAAKAVEQFKAFNAKLGVQA